MHLCLFGLLCVDSDLRVSKKDIDRDVRNTLLLDYAYHRSASMCFYYDYLIFLLVVLCIIHIIYVTVFVERLKIFYEQIIGCLHTHNTIWFSCVESPHTSI